MINRNTCRLPSFIHFKLLFFEQQCFRTLKSLNWIWCVSTVTNHEIHSDNCVLKTQFSNASDDFKSKLYTCRFKQQWSFAYRYLPGESMTSNWLTVNEEKSSYQDRWDVLQLLWKAECILTWMFRHWLRSMPALKLLIQGQDCSTRHFSVLLWVTLWQLSQMLP